jgi:hypothetical protein
MKSIFVLAIVALSLGACKDPKKETDGKVQSTLNNATAAIDPENGPKIVFERDVYDFGKIKSGEKIQYDFKLKNTGKSPLIISDATATCGCTVPEIPKAPILPGTEAVIKVIFDSSNKQGLQDKVITITSNAVPNQTTVHIVGEILEK